MLCQELLFDFSNESTKVLRPQLNPVGNFRVPPDAIMEQVYCCTTLTVA